MKPTNKTLFGFCMDIDLNMGLALYLVHKDKSSSKTTRGIIEPRYNKPLGSKYVVIGIDNDGILISTNADKYIAKIAYENRVLIRTRDGTYLTYDYGSVL